MTELRFRISFDAPIRVSTGRAGPGVDAAVDPTDPLPATSLKGVVRATATRLLGTDHRLIEAVFGSPRRESAWEWSGARTETVWTAPQRAARMQVVDHVAAHDMVALAEQVHTPAAIFTVTALADLPVPELDAHIGVLTIAATATRSLGAGRCRGTGWVHITCLNHPPTPERIRAFLTTETPA
ncbi:RAMP superfamily protein [Nocardia farcinica]|uniref:RAMP superfamily protein n=1 Tax=Nocardia farcinica TaxID=37329 RepID=UPI001895772D|nr:RAMP superfamily protein [Nocardia farcinica]MBF6523066.1 RAMP superfamily protein [Nocardia farcinica]